MGKNSEGGEVYFLVGLLKVCTDTIFIQNITNSLLLISAFHNTRNYFSSYFCSLLKVPASSHDSVSSYFYNISFS
ncbi:hypothetical protein HZS_2664 [Henneguya salminicola]|nr:hypothetical protein HZS_2664 [Henneguya salminicola]